MKVGKVSQTVLKRSILKQLQFQREEALFPPSIEEMCYGLELKEEEQFLVSDATLYGNEKDLGVFALAQVANDLASRGADPAGVSLQIMLPPYAYESRLKSMVEHVEQAGSLYGIQVLCAKAEVCPIISQAIVHMTGIGVLSKDTCIRSNGGRPQQDVVLLKWVGLEGTFRIMREKEEELAKRFIPAFLEKIRGLESQIFSVKELAFAREFGVSAMHQITNGGILVALWELAEASNVGVEVDLKKMAIRQETVEICEFCHLNPYQLTSTGSVLMFADRGEDLVQAFAEQGVQAVVLGKTTKDLAKVILGGEEKRFMDRPASDELLKLYENEGGTI